MITLQEQAKLNALIERVGKRVNSTVSGCIPYITDSTRPTDTPMHRGNSYVRVRIMFTNGFECRAWLDQGMWRLSDRTAQRITKFNAT